MTAARRKLRELIIVLAVAFWRAERIFWQRHKKRGERLR